jgi:hypothetical protein
MHLAGIELQGPSGNSNPRKNTAAHQLRQKRGDAHVFACQLLAVNCAVCIMQEQKKALEREVESIKNIAQKSEQVMSNAALPLIPPSLQLSPSFHRLCTGQTSRADKI